MACAIITFTTAVILAVGDVATCQADSHGECEGPASDHDAEILLQTQAMTPLQPGIPPKYGGCVLKSSDGAVPTNPYSVGASTGTSFEGFKKAKNVYGIKLLFNKGSKVMDEGYICHITNLIMHLLGPSPCNQPKQKEVVEMMYKKKCNTPVYWQQAGQVLDKGSSCDIMTVQTDQTDLQHFEILEHALHAINTCGYSPVFPEWSLLDKQAKAWQGIQHMRKNGLWDTKDYTAEPMEAEELRRILLQEYHWLLCRTMWGFFGGSYPDNPNWKLKTPAQLQKQHPIGYQLYMDTIAPLIAQVSHAQMASLKNNLKKSGTLGACTQSHVPEHVFKKTCKGGPDDDIKITTTPGPDRDDDDDATTTAEPDRDDDDTPTTPSPDRDDDVVDDDDSGTGDDNDDDKDHKDDDSHGDDDEDIIGDDDYDNSDHDEHNEDDDADTNDHGDSD